MCQFLRVKRFLHSFETCRAKASKIQTFRKIKHKWAAVRCKVTITNRFKNVLVLIEHIGGNGKQLKIMYVKTIFYHMGCNTIPETLQRFITNSGILMKHALPQAAK